MFFYFEARNKEKQIIMDTIEADSYEQAYEKLLNMGYLPSLPPFALRRTKISPKFTRIMSITLEIFVILVTILVLFFLSQI